MSQVFEFDQSESVESTGGKYASKPGKFHFMITQAAANPAKKDGTPMMGCLQVDMEIVAGTDETQIGKTFEARLWKGKPDDKDKGEMANKKLSCLAVALGGQHVPGGKGGIDIANIAARQIVAELAMRPGKGCAKESRILGSDSKTLPPRSWFVGKRGHQRDHRNDSKRFGSSSIGTGRHRRTRRLLVGSGR